MNRTLRSCFLLVALLAAVPAAATCVDPATIDRWPDRSGYTLHPRSGDRQYSVWLRGEMLFVDPNAPGLAIWIDAIRYQVEFMPSVELGAYRVADSDLLARHAALTFDEAQRGGTPLTEFEDLGDYARPDVGVHPAATFKRWRMHDAADRAAIYYSTTVVGDEVVVLSADVPADADANARARVERVMRHHADALDWNECSERGSAESPN
jgi:hypothetical protein